VADRLDNYRAKRDLDRTPEPRGEEQVARSGEPRFVIQQHHARSLHWDLRLEHEGTLASWALPRGIPAHPEENRLAVRTEDHPLEYLDFSGEIPAGTYGAGKMEIWDSGTYAAEKFRDDEVIAVFNGERVSGRYALFQTRGKDWMIHRMDPPSDPALEPMPDSIASMLASTGPLPRDDAAYGYELKWDGVRAVGYVDSGRLRLVGRNGTDFTPRYPELRALADEQGARRMIIDGEVVAFDADGRPSFELLQQRMHLASDAAVRRKLAEVPVAYMIFDLLWLEGHSALALPYRDRRTLLADLGLDGPGWRVPAHREGDGKLLLAAAREQGLEGVVAKRLDSAYEPGRRTRAWIKVKIVTTQDVVIGGWTAGEGGRAKTLGALAAGVYDDEGELRYAGKVGSGLTAETLTLLLRKLEGLARDSSPFTGRQPPKRTNFVEPELVASVAFTEWTRTGTLRAPVFKGLRDDVEPATVVRESL
jgi:bifunctional non-homologous end joining protein LigD